MNEYAKYFDKNNKYVNLLVNHKKILKKYSEIWNEIKSLIKKEFNRESVYNDKYIKIKIKTIRYIQIFNIIKYPKITNIIHAYL